MRPVVVLTVLLAAVWAKQFSYEGYKVFRVQPASENHVKALATVGKNDYFDFWSPLRFDGKPIDVMVDPLAQKSFIAFLNQNGIKHAVFIENFESVVQAERDRQLLTPRLQQGRISFTKYCRFDEISSYLDQLAKDHSDIASTEIIGKSYEGRELKIIKISADPGANKPIIFIDAGIHAREWIAPAQATYIINQLVENSTNANLLEKVDWHILPVFNPDGYEHSHDRERLWRKTRSKGEICDGTDGNRNFDFHWGGPGSSSLECSQVYKGPEAFSESETRTFRDYILGKKNNIKLYLTLHSAAQCLLFPWGFTTALPDDYHELQALGERVADAIKQVDGTEYRVGTFTNVLGPGAGGSDDWVKAVAGVELSYTVQLPGARNSCCGFDPPPSDILAIVREIWVGIVEFHSYIKEKLGNRKV